MWLMERLFLMRLHYILELAKFSLKLLAFFILPSLYPDNFGIEVILSSISVRYRHIIFSQ